MSGTSRFPDAVIIGAPKCGSTTLFHWLGLHPDIAPIVNKEPHFLSDSSQPMHPTFSRRPNVHLDGIGAYPELWPDAMPGQRLVEATPSYIYHSTPRSVLSAQDCDARVIVVLRRPEDRVHSLYRHLRERSAVVSNDVDFASFLDIADANGFTGPFGAIANNASLDSEFGRLIEPWLTSIGPERLTVVSTDELRADGPAILNDLWAQMGLGPLDLSPDQLEIRNQAYAARFPALQTLLHRARRHGEIPNGRVLQAMRIAYRRHGRVDSAESSSTDGTDSETAALKEELARKFDGDLDLLRQLLGRDVFAPATQRTASV